MDEFDLIIVGGGIAGASLATVMARSGATVLVLERQTAYRDYVRGELLWPWGVKVARELELESVLLEAGARVVRWVVAYDEGSDVSTKDDAGAALPGVGGSLNLSHPAACTALVSAAMSAGAEVCVGVRDVRLSKVHRPVVRWTLGNGDVREATAPLVVGADGRQSSIRSQASIPFEVDPPAHLIAGMLVDGPECDVNSAARESDVLFLAFPQKAGRARLYFNFPTEQRSRFVGRDAERRFLDAANLRSLRDAAEWHQARTAGPCATFPGTDSRARSPLGDGVVLIGDAAGFENPLRGQGLAMALRDVQDVSRALLDGRPLDEALSEYARARTVRQGLANLATTLTVWANDGFRPQDPAQRASRYDHIRHDELLGQLSSTIWAGFDDVPPELSAAEVAERLERHS